MIANINNMLLKQILPYPYVMQTLYTNLGKKEEEEEV